LISALALLFVLGCCGTKNTTTGKDGKRIEAPKHNAPDQDRIDSLKQEKMKGKP
jgi:hypothetical protein